ncbi:MAG: hypothetical protein Q7J36_16060 [Thiobacillus sp.]|nr:hypothetical protein [Thiobacillus sp.]
MNDMEGLIDKMDRELGSNSPATQEEKIDHIRERLSLELKLLHNGKSDLLDKPHWWLALDAFEHLVFLLRHGEANLDTQRMVAEFLGQQVGRGNETIVYGVLGLPPPKGRPRNSLNELRAVAAYETRINEGLSEADAERAAWETLYPSKEYDLLAARHVTSETGAFNNEAERLMFSTVRPLLRRVKVLETKRAGRPSGRKSETKP